MRILQLQTDEQSLIKKCLKGDRLAQRRLYDRHASRMLAVCKRYVKSLEDAEEVFSNGFIKVFEKLEQYSGAGSLEGWIRTIMVRESLNFLKSKQNKSLEDNEEDIESYGETVLFEDELTPEHLMGLVAELPEGYRTIFNLYAIEGYNHAEIGEMLGISDNTSKSQLSKARKHLQSRVIELQYLEL